MGKELYFWPFANASLVVDRSYIQNEQKQAKKMTWKSIPIDPVKLKGFEEYESQKIIVVDDEKTFDYCSIVLESCFKYGVDLEGRLAVNGYIDFIQISCIN